jgi:hypothetical protein
MNGATAMSHPGRLARCPACDDDLTGPMSLDRDGRPRRPGLRLELCVESTDTIDWRISLADGSRFWAPSQNFHPARVRMIYLICGDGHVFLDRLTTAGHHDLATSRGDRFEMIAAVGSTAAGKSYLVLRTLSQHLVVDGLTAVDAAGTPLPVSVVNIDWLLEAEPLEMLKRHYEKTEISGLPLDPTARWYMMPREFLRENVAAALVSQIIDIHTELLGEENVDRESWGKRIRQPIVRRYRIGNRLIMAGVADLSGELFHGSSVDEQHNRFLLGNYGTLVWAIDPVVCVPFPKFLPIAAESSVLASMRPDALLAERTEEIRRDRGVVQRQLAGMLADLSSITQENGAVQFLQVCVTKADLIRLALAEGASLRKLGKPDAVANGIARYLFEVARRASGPNQTITVEPSALEMVVGRIIRLSHDMRLASKAARQFADALLTHFDNAEQFWQLAHVGGGMEVLVPPGEPEAILPAGRIVVPDLDEHVAGSLVPGQSGVLRTRDLVMSALGCGIAYGLAFDQNLEEILRQPWRELRFFLCSPLAETPVPVAASAERIRPRETEAFFPEVDARSAALSQLLLAMLRRVRS